MGSRSPRRTRVPRGLTGTRGWHRHRWRRARRPGLAGAATENAETVAADEGTEQDGEGEGDEDESDSGSSLTHVPIKRKGSRKR